MSGPSPGLPDDDAVARALNKALSREPLDEAAYARIRSVVASEWRANIRPKPRWTARRWSTIGIAAGLAAVLVALAVLQASRPPAVLGVVARGGLTSGNEFLTSRALPAGAPLHVGEGLRVFSAVLVELPGGGTLRLARGTQLVVAAADGIALQVGEAYVDLPPGLSRASTFVVNTPLGVVEHIGTQFDVTVGNDLRIRVREGEIRLRRGSQTKTAGAGTEVIVPPSGEVSQHSIATHGADWAWVEALPPRYSIENRPLLEFLQRMARETGRQLRFTDDRARQVAERILLHGSVSGLPPDAALETIFATTTLRYELEDGQIEVSSGS